MSKRKGRRPTSLESGGGPRNNADSQALFQGRVQSANLADKPIEDLLLEKRLADRGSETLLPNFGQAGGTFNPHQLQFGLKLSF